MAISQDAGYVNLRPCEIGSRRGENPKASRVQGQAWNDLEKLWDGTGRKEIVGKSWHLIALPVSLALMNPSLAALASLASREAQRRVWGAEVAVCQAVKLRRVSG